MSPLEYVTAAEAARRIGVSEKTVRTWVMDGGPHGKLSAHHAAANRLAIPITEVERIARERGQYKEGEIPSIIDLLKQVETIQREQAEQSALIEHLQAKIDALEKGNIHPESWPGSIEPTERPLKTVRPRRQSEPKGEPLPEGAILARHFAEQHSVNPYTFRDHYTKGRYGDICMISSRPKPGREHETEYYVMPEQKQEIYAYWQRNDVPFTIPEQETLS
jgi:hypothetical protein